MQTPITNQLRNMDSMPFANNRISSHPHTDNHSNNQLLVVCLLVFILINHESTRQYAQSINDAWMRGEYLLPLTIILALALLCIDTQKEDFTRWSTVINKDTFLLGVFGAVAFWWPNLKHAMHVDSGPAPGVLSTSDLAWIALLASAIVWCVRHQMHRATVVPT